MAPARLTWSFDMRLLADILFDPASGLTPSQRVDIFNAVFKDQIRSFGFVDGVPHNRLAIQSYEKKKEKPNADWVRIRSSNPTEADAERRRSMRAKADSFVQSRQQSGTDSIQSPQVRVQRQTAAKSSKKRSADSINIHGGSTPLSKRPAIGLWTPETPQHPSFRQEVAVSKPVTPKKAATARKPVTPKSHRLRPDGSTILVANNIIIRDVVPSVSQHRAQPPLPKLLFRLWREDPSQRDSRQGFWSRRHHRKNALSSTPPGSSSIDATDILDHMDRRRVDTPFISTSNRLIWIAQQLVTAIKTHQGKWNLSVIDVDALDKRGVFWARPFHDEVRPSKGFTKGAGRYYGTYEFLIWQKIPETAILHTFKARDLPNLAFTREVRQTLRFEVLHGRGSLATKITLLHGHKVPLSHTSINTIATLLPFFGIHSPYNPGHISAIITGICEGWGLDIPFHDEQEWQALSNYFANRLRCFEPRERQDVKFAFLEGVAWGCAEPNAKHTVAGMASQERKARDVGLGSPGDILVHELDGLKLALKLRERGEQRVLRRYHAIQPAAYNGGDEMDGAGHEPESDELGGGFASDGDEEIVFDSGDDDFVMA